MSEEFLTDIIGAVDAPKTEAEMVADLQGDTPEKSVEKQPEAKDVKVETGSEATPDDSSSGVKAEEADAVDPVKELATQLGWREDHVGDDAVDAKTYILKSKDIQKSMSQHNKDLKEQLQGLNGSVEALKQHNESVYQAEVKKLTGEITELKKDRRAAIELADVDKVDELDKQIDDKQKDIDAPKPVEKKAADAVNPDFDTWIVDNQWYNDDKEMAAFADTIAQQYAGAPLSRVYALVRNKVQEVFPDKFEAPKPAADAIKVPEIKNPVGPASPVERSSAKGSDVAFTKADLSDEQKQIMNQFVKGGIMTEEAYVAGIAKMQ